QRVEGLIEEIGALVAVGGGLALLLTALVQQLPSGDGHDETAGDAQDRNRDAVELENNRAQEERADEHEERIPGDTPGKDAAGLGRRAARQCKEHERRS